MGRGTLYWAKMLTGAGVLLAVPHLLLAVVLGWEQVEIELTLTPLALTAYLLLLILALAMAVDHKPNLRQWLYIRPTKKSKAKLPHGLADWAKPLVYGAVVVQSVLLSQVQIAVASGVGLIMLAFASYAYWAHRQVEGTANGPIKNGT